jgi:hypothetical protein
MLLFAVLGLMALTVFGFIVMGLWNWLAPAVFGARIITFWQALGILVLSKILFGGFFRGRGRGGRDRLRIIDRWERMTPEEREKFRQGMRGQCGGSRGGGREGSPRERGTAPA